MRRHLAVAAVVFSVAAASFAATEGTRVAPFRLGAVDVNEFSVGAFVNGSGFGAVTLREAPIAGGPAQIRYTPIDANGHPAVTQARALVSSPGLSSARLFDAGSNSVLAWLDGGAVTVASLSHGGVLGTPHVLGQGRNYLDLGCNASRCVVAWYDSSTGNTNAAVTDTAGNVVIGGLTIPFIPYYAASDPTGVLLFGYNQAARFDTTTGATTFSITLAQNVSIQSADFDGENYAFVWNSYDGAYHVNAAKVTLNGAISSPKVVWTGDRSVGGLRLEWNGSEHLFAFGIDDGEGPGSSQIPELVGSTNIYVRRLTAALDPLGLEVKVTNNAEANRPSDVVWNGSAYYLVYDDARVDTYFGVPVSARGALISALPGVVANDVIAIGPLSQRNPVLAAGDGVRLAAWTETDRTDNTTSLRAVRFRRDGSRIDASPIEIASAKSIVLSSTHAVAAAGDDFLIVWREGDVGGNHAAIVRDSTVERMALPFSGNYSPLKVAFNGSSWLVVTLAPSSQILGVRISRSGQILTPQPILLGSASDFDVAASGDRFGVLSAPYVSVCTVNCAPRVLSIWEADANHVVTDVFAVNGGVVKLAGGPSGFLVFSADNHARVFDRNGNAAASSVSFLRTDFIVDSQPFGTGWLVWLLGKPNRLMLLDAAATTVTPAATVDALDAFAVDNGTVTTLASIVDELPPNGFAIALVMRDLAPIVPPRRRAAR